MRLTDALNLMAHVKGSLSGLVIESGVLNQESSKFFFLKASLHPSKEILPRY